MTRIVAFALLLSLAACTTTSTVRQPHAPVAGQAYSVAFVSNAGEDLAGIAGLVSVIRGRLRDAGMLATDAGPGPRVEVVLKHYYVRADMVRAVAGMLAGRDRIASQVTVLDGNGTRVGRFDVETTNLSAWGSREALMDRHADEIVSRLRP